MAGAISEDIADPQVLDVSSLAQHLQDVLALVELLSHDFRKSIQPITKGDVFHFFTVWTKEGFEGRGLSKTIAKIAADHARSLGSV